MAEAKAITKAVAIKKFLEEGVNGRETRLQDILQLKKTCSDVEWDKMGKDAAQALGLTLKEV